MGSGITAANSFRVYHDNTGHLYAKIYSSGGVAYTMTGGFMALFSPSSGTEYLIQFDWQFTGGGDVNMYMSVNNGDVLLNATLFPGAGATRNKTSYLNLGPISGSTAYEQRFRGVMLYTGIQGGSHSYYTLPQSSLNGDISVQNTFSAFNITGMPVYSFTMTFTGPCTLTHGFVAQKLGRSVTMSLNTWRTATASVATFFTSSGTIPVGLYPSSGGYNTYTTVIDSGIYDFGTMYISPSGIMTVSKRGGSNFTGGGTTGFGQVECTYISAL
jgi:hypothetical protein